MEDKEFDRLLKTSRIRLTDKERAVIKRDIEDILEYFNAIDKADPGNVEPAYQPTEVAATMRDDVVKGCDFPDQILKNTKTHKQYVLGPDI
ncbi:MAG: Asp-tRNA(Asn)/Glu-tRNA(Gln) amidotransferase subunit GatC [Candidatus Micrarchaeota archaeon]|nr:Asp-tRNA(Asn)/Glu-tRNA(Gln) amidotransferase subunit GatC [Candidatus Micrarchaeota archaeon]